MARHKDRKQNRQDKRVTQQHFDELENLEELEFSMPQSAAKQTLPNGNTFKDEVIGYINKIKERKQLNFNIKVVFE